MPDVTPNYELPFPVITDPVQVHADMQTLAAKVDQVVKTLDDFTKGIGAQLTYDPVWSGPVALSIGNGTKIGRYTKIGRRVTGFVQIIRGSTTNQGSDIYTFSLPEPAVVWNTVTGSGYVRVGALRHGLTTLGVHTGTIGVSYTDGGARVSHNNRPGGGSWAANDEILVGFDYIAGA